MLLSQRRPGLGFYPYRLVSLICLLLLLLAGCNNFTPSPTLPPTSTAPTPQKSSTPLPTRTPTPHPLGSAANPVVFAVVSPNLDAKASSAAEQVAVRLEQITAFNIQVRVFQSFNELLDGLENGKVHLTFLPPFTYLLASQAGTAQVTLMSNHFGVYQYGSQFLANVSSKFNLHFDPTSNRNTTDAFSALKQLQDKRPCWVDSRSASGYVLALGLLNQNGIQVQEGAFLQSHSAVVRALYITGICDFGVTFATTGDPRSSTTVTADLTDVMNRVVILWQTEPVIPNLNVSFWSGVSKDMRDDLVFALQDVVKSEQGRLNLSTATAYEILDFKPVNDTFYEPLSEALIFSRINLETLIGY